MNKIQKLVLCLFIFMVVMVVMVGIGRLLPGTVHVERSILIKAPAATVFTVLNGFRQFQRWSPWIELDPHVVIAHEGPVAGPGAKMHWRGNDLVGRGRQEILESTAYRHIQLRLVSEDFRMADNRVTYAIVSADEGTRLTWSFDADAGDSMTGRWLALITGGLLGSDYERGLARLKSFVEALPVTDFSGLDVQEQQMTALPIAYIATRSARESQAMQVALSVAYSEISGYLDTQGLKQTARPLAIYRAVENGTLSFDAAIPVDSDEAIPGGKVRLGRLPAGRVVRVVHQGPHAGLDVTDRRARAFLAAAGYRSNGDRWEQYVDDPAKTQEADLITLVYYPVK
ncbi:MAG: SRPBCC family protein [Nevskiales bacterium]|nr:SRPBCC family protein [Nevskiales bacterium]